MPEKKDLNEEKLNKIINAVNDISNRIADVEGRLDRIERKTESKVLPQSNLPSPSRDMMETIREKMEKNKKESAGESKGTYLKLDLQEKKSFESELGIKWFGRIGVIALIFGISFFLKYAFENDWIGETGRVIVGVMSGIALIVCGDLLRKKYAQYSQTLTGGGIGILYLSVYASFAYYNLINQIPAFAAMSIITFSAVFLAINYESIVLAALAIIGGFLTPALISTGVNNQIALFLYMTLLNLGILSISFFRNWRTLNIIGLASTAVLFLGWFVSYYSEDQLFLSEIFLIIWFLIYAASTLAHNIVFKKQAYRTDAGIISLNAIWFFTASYIMLMRDYSDFMGFFAIIMSAIYFGLAYASYYLNPEDKYLAFFLPALSIFFITIAAPMQFDGNLVTISWSVEAVLLLWAGINLNKLRLRQFALMILTLVFLRLIFIDSPVKDMADYSVIFNWRFVAFVIGFLSAISAYFIYSKFGKNLMPEESKVRSIMLFMANFLLIWILSSEASVYYDKQNYIGSKGVAPFCNTETYVQGRGYVKDPYCEQKYTEYQNTMKNVYANNAGIKNSKNTALSVLWTVYAISLLVIGFANKNRLMRLMGIGLFGIVIFKLFFIDLWSLGAMYRIISSFTLGLTLLLASFAYNKFKDKIKEII